MRPLSLVSIFFIGLTITSLSAQETSGAYGGSYGYTSVNYNSSTNTVTIYAETAVDDTYYSPAVDTAVNDNKGYLFTSGSSTSFCPAGTAASEGSGKCGDLSDVHLLDSRASVLRKRVVDGSDTKGRNDREALLWLIQAANEEIRKHFPAKQEN